MTLDTTVAKKWKSLTIMGGTSWGSGNTTAAAEFNFYHDPEAAASVFAKMPASLVPRIVTWETTLKGQFLGEKINFHPDQKTTKVIFLFENSLINFFQGKWLWERCKKMGIFSKPLFTNFCICDFAAAAVLVNEKAIKSSRIAPVAVATQFGIARGAMIIDNRPVEAQGVQTSNAGFSKAMIIDEIDMQLVQEMEGIQIGDSKVC